MPVTIEHGLKKPILTNCKFCKRDYVYPCHGESAQCMNARWVRERAKAKA